MGIFEQASRIKLRIAYKGLCSVEDLWDISVEELDGIYQGLRDLQKASESESLISKPTERDERLTLSIDIIKHIVHAKLEAQEARKLKAENRMRRARLAEILAKKEDEKLSEMSEEDLRKEIAALEE